MGWHTMLDLLAITLNGQKPEQRSIYMQKNAALCGVIGLAEIQTSA